MKNSQWRKMFDPWRGWEGKILQLGALLMDLGHQGGIDLHAFSCELKFDRFAGKRICQLTTELETLSALVACPSSTEMSRFDSPDQ